MRRATPDSEAVASSEDERPWPMATTFGSLPRKENGVPGLGGGIWSSSQSRGSFKLGEQARRNAAREARMGAPNNPSARPANTPSPATSSEHGANSLPFAIPLQPTPKVGRSLSHSQGQREMPASSVAGVQQAVAGMERPAALPLGLLNEEVEDGDADSDRDSDFGGMLTQTVSHPVFSNLHRTSTLPTQYSSPFSAASNPRRSDTFDVGGFDRRYEAEFGDLTLSELGMLLPPDLRPRPCCRCQHCDVTSQHDSMACGMMSSSSSSSSRQSDSNLFSSSLRTLTSTSVADILGLGRAAELQREPPSLNGRHSCSPRLDYRKQQL
jgi:hypothetical protein